METLDVFFKVYSNRVSNFIKNSSIAARVVVKCWLSDPEVPGSISGTSNKLCVFEEYLQRLLWYKQPVGYTDKVK